jgi:hypothetical protein
MPIYLGPRVIEGSLHSLDNNIRHVGIMLTMNGLELSVLKTRSKVIHEEFEKLSVKFKTLQLNSGTLHNSTPPSSAVWRMSV